jgi:hypothetical protein
MKPAAPVAAAALTAEPSLIQANERFLEAWLLRKNVDEAATAISPDAGACVNLYLNPGESPKTTATEQSVRMRAGLERVSAAVGAASRLEEIIEPVVPTDTRFRIVNQPRGKAFHLLGAPDWMGPTLSCEVRLAGGDTLATEEGAERGYGNYYISALQFLNGGVPGAALALGWHREGDAWRIYAFKIIEP